MSKKTDKVLFLRKGVRFAMKYIADDNATVLFKGRPTVAGLVRSLADGKWFRPDLADIPFCSLEDKGDKKYSQVTVDGETHKNLCKIAVELGFATLEDMLEDFSTGIWELKEE
jgi:hypothetical protein